MLSVMMVSPLLSLSATRRGHRLQHVFLNELIDVPLIVLIDLHARGDVVQGLAPGCETLPPSLLASSLSVALGCTALAVLVKAQAHLTLMRPRPRAGRGITPLRVERKAQLNPISVCDVSSSVVLPRVRATCITAIRTCRATGLVWLRWRRVSPASTSSLCSFPSSFISVVLQARDLRLRPLQFFPLSGSWLQPLVGVMVTSLLYFMRDGQAHSPLQVVHVVFQVRLLRRTPYFLWP